MVEVLDVHIEYGRSYKLQLIQIHCHWLLNRRNHRNCQFILSKVNLTKGAILKLISITIVVGFILLIIAAFFAIKLQIDNVKDIQIQQQEEHRKTNQFLLSTVDWSTRRQRLTLFIRDIIVKSRLKVKNPIPLEEAYLIAETDVVESEKYPNVDVLLLLAMQRCESRFNRQAVSSEGAIGINQLMPSTGRLLCTHFGIEYCDSLLYDIATSTKLAAKLLDILYTTYQRYDLTLADYNGGPYAASYYKNKRSSLPEETAAYVPSVLKTWENYKEAFKVYNINLGSNSTVINLGSTSNIDTINKLGIIKP